MPAVVSSLGFGRFERMAVRILTVLRRGPRHPAGLAAELDWPVGRTRPGSLYAAIARLERTALIEQTTNGHGRRAYRLTEAGATTTIVDER